MRALRTAIVATLLLSATGLAGARKPPRSIGAPREVSRYWELKLRYDPRGSVTVQELLRREAAAGKTVSITEQSGPWRVALLGPKGRVLAPPPSAYRSSGPARTIGSSAPGSPPPWSCASRTSLGCAPCASSIPPGRRSSPTRRAAPASGALPPSEAPPPEAPVVRELFPDAKPPPAAFPSDSTRSSESTDGGKLTESGKTPESSPAASGSEGAAASPPAPGSAPAPGSKAESLAAGRLGVCGCFAPQFVSARSSAATRRAGLSVSICTLTPKTGQRLLK